MPDQWPHVLRLVHAEQHGPDHWRTIGERITEDWQQRPEMPPEILAKIACPMLVIVGEHELEFKRRQAGVIEASSANARVEEVPGDHHVHLQHPDVVNPLVEAFLDELGETAGSPAPA
jgi:pimeloyl-ACP methyl ester carboxylesterase